MPQFCRCPFVFTESAVTTCPTCGLRRTPPTDADPATLEERGPRQRGAKARRRRAAYPRIAGYRILREIGRGGMGVVYKARHLGLNRLVAIKTIREPAGLIRFRNEARAVARLQHPNIVQIFEENVEPRTGLPHISMELAEGGSLARRLGGKPWPALQAARLVETLARAVHYAHDRNVAHRDLKPANVLLAKDGTPKIADFGLAKLLDRRFHLTQTGSRLGTCCYVAPEQALARPGTDWRLVDVYGLGAILYETLTGRPPFQAAVETETLLQVLGTDPVPPRQLQPGVPRDLETVCLKCLEKDPRRRYASAEALAEDLGRFLKGEPVQARPVGWTGRLVRWCRRRPVLAVLAAALLLAVLGGISASLILWRQAAHSATEALANLRKEEIARQEADKHFAMLRQLLMNNVHVSASKTSWGHPNIDVNPLPTPMLMDAEACLSRLLQKRPEDQELRILLADVLTRLGIRQVRVDSSPSWELFERAAHLWEQVPPELARAPKHLASRASTHEHLGREYSRQKRLDMALPASETSFRLWKQLAEEHPDPRHQDGLFYAARDLGALLIDSGRSEEEIARRFEELRGRPELLGEQGSAVLLDVLRVQQRYTAVRGHRQANERAAALSAAREAAAILDRYYRQPALDKITCLHLAQPAYQVATDLRQCGAEREALHLAERVNRALRQLIRAAPEDHYLVQELSTSWHQVSKAHWDLDQVEDTLHALRAALEMQRQACILAPAVAEYRQSLGLRLLQLGRKLCELGHLDEAETHFREWQTLWPEDAGKRAAALEELRKWAAQAEQGSSPEKRLEYQRYRALCARLEGAAPSTGTAQP